MNVNIGGTKKWNSVSESVRAQWKVLDIAGKPDFKHNINSGLRLPFKDGSVSNFFTSHTMEHVRFWLVVPLMKEMYRSLVPGGKVRVVVPNIAIHIKAYNERNAKWRAKGLSKRVHRELYPATYLGSLLGYFYSFVKGGASSSRDGHHMAFDMETLQWCLRGAGFRKVTEKRFGHCSSVFAGLDFKRHARNSLFVEGTK